jgi:hypothetical protein
MAYNNNNKEKPMHELFRQERRFCMISIPLLLRLFEYIREEPTTDEDLHFMAERIHELADDMVKLTMNQYQSIIPHEKVYNKPKATLE